MDEWKVKIVDAGYKITKELYIFREIGNGKREHIIDGKIKTIEHGEIPSKPTLELTDSALQQLAEQLNEKGYKPQKGYLEGKLEATELHLKDTRTLLKLPNYEVRGFTKEVVRTPKEIDN